MNNFIVAPEKVKCYTAWFWIIVAALILLNIPAPRTTPITGYSGLNALHELITAPWMKTAFQVIYWGAFIWMVWQIAAHLPEKHRLLKWTLWAVIITCVCRWLFVWLVPVPDLLSNQFRVHHIILSFLINLYIVAMLWAGWLLVRNYGGRLRLLGWAILVWQLIPMVLPWLLYRASVNTNVLLFICWGIESALAIYTFWRMRQVFIPNWNEKLKMKK